METGTQPIKNEDVELEQLDIENSNIESNVEDELSNDNELSNDDDEISENDDLSLNDLSNEDEIELQELRDELAELQTELKDIENQIRQNKAGENSFFKELMAVKSDLMKQILEVEMDIQFIQVEKQQAENQQADNQ